MVGYFYLRAREEVSPLTPHRVAVSGASAEAIFGSTSRGDNDVLSDRDILIVDDNVQALRYWSQKLEEDGWSVASYTFAKLEALSRMGALFIQHLKLEASIIADRDGRLSSLLRSFEPRRDYSRELAENCRLAALAGEVPPGSRGALLAADILYVATRNHGVLLLAERGIHCYSYSVLICALEDERLIPAGTSRDLASLRFLKCLYREGEAAHGEHIPEALDRALAALQAYQFPRRMRQVAPSAIVHGPAPKEPAFAYLHLRDLERRLVALKSAYPEITFDSDLARLSSWIANPRAYSALSERIAPRLRNKIENLLRATSASLDPNNPTANPEPAIVSIGKG
ncbi:hypothetical protein [Mesorhizobium sp. M0571]|uniref:hypothetical protein n=1 Tax=Mesorhizobium sp. M0571 TaxID=2956960 RepID=UPI003339AF5E